MAGAAQIIGWVLDLDDTEFNSKLSAIGTRFEKLQSTMSSLNLSGIEGSSLGVQFDMVASIKPILTSILDTILDIKAQISELLSPDTWADMKSILSSSTGAVEPQGMSDISKFVTSPQGLASLVSNIDSMKTSVKATEGYAGENKRATVKKTAIDDVLFKTFTGKIFRIDYWVNLICRVGRLIWSPFKKVVSLFAGDIIGDIWNVISFAFEPIRAALRTQLIPFIQKALPVLTIVAFNLGKWAVKKMEAFAKWVKEAMDTSFDWQSESKSVFESVLSYWFDLILNKDSWKNFKEDVKTTFNYIWKESIWDPIIGKITSLSDAIIAYWDDNISPFIDDTMKIIKIGWLSMADSVLGFVADFIYVFPGTADMVKKMRAKQGEYQDEIFKLDQSFARTEVIRIVFDSAAFTRSEIQQNAPAELLAINKQYKRDVSKGMGIAEAKNKRDKELSDLAPKAFRYREFNEAYKEAVSSGMPPEEARKLWDESRESVVNQFPGSSDQTLETLRRLRPEFDPWAEGGVEEVGGADTLPEVEGTIPASIDPSQFPDPSPDIQEVNKSIGKELSVLESIRGNLATPDWVNDPDFSK